MDVKKRVLQIVLFLVIMLLTFYALLSGRDLAQIGQAMRRMSPFYLIPAVGFAVFFVCAEGYMIWYLLRSMKAKKGRRACKFPVPMYSVFLYRILLFRHHSIGHRWAAGSALLHE